MSELLRVDTLRKRFPGVEVLKGISFSLQAGRVYGLVGENGAGKSTLVKILMGIHQPDGGDVYVAGEKTILKNPHQIRLSYGIEAVFQEHALIPQLSVAENIFLDCLDQFYHWGLIDRKQMHAKAQEVLARVHLDIDTTTLAGKLSEGERSMVELARAIYRDPSILILDEVTASLETKAVERLFSIIDDLRSRGKTVMFISHRLQEVLAICDEILVMKNGSLEGIIDNTERDDPASQKQRIISMMSGVDRTISFPPKAGSGVTDDVVLSLRGIRNEYLRGVNLDIHKGEIVALAGLRGQGQSLLLRSIAGLVPNTEGEIYIQGHRVTMAGPRDLVKQGVFYLSDRRDVEELWLSHDVCFNVSLPTVSSRTRFGLITSDNNRAVQTVVKDLRIVTASVSQMVLHLSGGNRQKVVLGKYLLARPKVFLLDQPTMGLDIAAKVEMYHLLRGFCKQGIPILVVLNDIEEILNFPDRVVILREGKTVRELTGRHINEQELLDSYYALGEESYDA